MSTAFIRKNIMREDARRILEDHISGLQALSQNLPKMLECCVQKLQELSGRLVCVGVGKSAFIMHKIASCFSSIGVSAYALDPTHAVHGDLGALKKEDILILGSYGGASAELVPILSFAQEKKIYSMLITAFPLRALGKMANMVLPLPQVQEVGSLGCVPSTSSVIMLALGDILVSALEHHITLEHYQKHHPHGILGFKLTPIGQVMTVLHALPLVQPKTPITETLLIMSEKRLGCVGVVDEAKKLIGVISDGDIRRACIDLGDITEYYAHDVMQSAPKTVPASILVQDALRLMEQHKITFIFVVDGAQRPLGVFHIHDGWRAIQ